MTVATGRRSLIRTRAGQTIVVQHNTNSPRPYSRKIEVQGSKGLIDKYPTKEEAKDAQYQRLINFYNTNAPTLLTEIDDYVNSNPAPERADQAKLLKAEYYYKKGQFPEAAPVYAELRTSQLSPSGPSAEFPAARPIRHEPSR